MTVLTTPGAERCCFKTTRLCVQLLHDVFLSECEVRKEAKSLLHDGKVLCPLLQYHKHSLSSIGINGNHLFQLIREAKLPKQHNGGTEDDIAFSGGALRIAAENCPNRIQHVITHD